MNTLQTMHNAMKLSQEELRNIHYLNLDSANSQTFDATELYDGFAYAKTVPEGSSLVCEVQTSRGTGKMEYVKMSDQKWHIVRNNVSTHQIYRVMPTLDVTDYNGAYFVDNDTERRIIEMTIYNVPTSILSESKGLQENTSQSVLDIIDAEVETLKGFGKNSRKGLSNEKMSEGRILRIQEAKHVSRARSKPMATVSEKAKNSADVEVEISALKSFSGNSENTLSNEKMRENRILDMQVQRIIQQIHNAKRGDIIYIGNEQWRYTAMWERFQKLIDGKTWITMDYLEGEMKTRKELLEYFKAEKGDTKVNTKIQDTSTSSEIIDNTTEIKLLSKDDIIKLKNTIDNATIGSIITFTTKTDEGKWTAKYEKMEDGTWKHISSNISAQDGYAIGDILEIEYTDDGAFIDSNRGHGIISAELTEIPQTNPLENQALNKEKAKLRSFKNNSQTPLPNNKMKEGRILKMQEALNTNRRIVEKLQKTYNKASSESIISIDDALKNITQTIQEADKEKSLPILFEINSEWNKETKETTMQNPETQIEKIKASWMKGIQKSIKAFFKKHKIILSHHYARLQRYVSEKMSQLHEILESKKPQTLEANWEQIVSIRKRIEASQNGEGKSLTEPQRAKLEKEAEKLLEERKAFRKKTKKWDIQAKIAYFNQEIVKAQELVANSQNGKGQSMTPATRLNIEETIKKMKENVKQLEAKLL